MQMENSATIGTVIDAAENAIEDKIKCVIVGEIGVELPDSIRFLWARVVGISANSNTCCGSILHTFKHCFNLL